MFQFISTSQSQMRKLGVFLLLLFSLLLPSYSVYILLETRGASRKVSYSVGLLIWVALWYTVLNGL